MTRRPDVVPPDALSRVMRDALTAIRDGTHYLVMPVTRRALTRRGLVQRVARASTRGPGITAASGYDLVITEAGRAVIAAKEAVTAVEAALVGIARVFALECAPWVDTLWAHKAVAKMSTDEVRRTLEQMKRQQETYAQISMVSAASGFVSWLAAIGGAT